MNDATTNLLPCPACGRTAEWMKFAKRVLCSYPKCRVIGPEDDETAAKWNALPRRDATPAPAPSQPSECPACDQKACKCAESRWYLDDIDALRQYPERRTYVNGERMRWDSCPESAGIDNIGNRIPAAEALAILAARKAKQQPAPADASKVPEQVWVERLERLLKDLRDNATTARQLQWNQTAVAYDDAAVKLELAINEAKAVTK